MFLWYCCRQLLLLPWHKWYKISVKSDIWFWIDIFTLARRQSVQSISRWLQPLSNCLFMKIRSVHFDFLTLRSAHEHVQWNQVNVSVWLTFKIGTFLTKNSNKNISVQLETGWRSDLMIGHCANHKQRWASKTRLEQLVRIQTVPSLFSSELLTLTLYSRPLCWRTVHRRYDSGDNMLSATQPLLKG